MTRHYAVCLRTLACFHENDSLVGNLTDLVESQQPGTRFLAWRVCACSAARYFIITRPRDDETEQSAAAAGRAAVRILGQAAVERLLAGKLNLVVVMFFLLFAAKFGTKSDK